MDILRYNAANAAVFAGVSDAAERNLRAAALRYGVKITCFAIGPRGEVAPRPPPPGRVAVPRRAFDTRPWRVRPQVASADFGPKPGVEARTELFLVRRGDHFLSVTKDDGSKGSELFANVPLGEVVPELEEPTPQPLWQWPVLHSSSRAFCVGTARLPSARPGRRPRESAPQRRFR